MQTETTPKKSFIINHSLDKEVTECQQHESHMLCVLSTSEVRGLYCKAGFKVIKVTSGLNLGF